MLSGVSKVCKKCSKTCKQWEQIKVIRCPNYKEDFDHSAKK